jgi:hypothetical protein
MAPATKAVNSEAPHDKNLSNLRPLVTKDLSTLRPLVTMLTLRALIVT